MGKFKAIIFDMDGLLVDSMKHWINLDEGYFAGLDMKLQPEHIQYMTGRSMKENIAWLIKKFNLPDSIEDLVTDRMGRQNSIYTELCEPMPGVENLLQFIQKKGVKQAIATGAPPFGIDCVVDRFKWREYFSALISAEHVDHVGKPDPRVYLHVADVLKVNPNDCLVFEDAENGVTSAKGAGMTCIAVPDERWSFGNFSQADLIVDTLADEKIYNFLEKSI